MNSKYTNWGQPYNAALARGHDHGSAAFIADRWEKKHLKETKGTGIVPTMKTPPDQSETRNETNAASEKLSKQRLRRQKRQKLKRAKRRTEKTT